VSKLYHINEVFYSPQGEGARQGSMNVFLRFAGCNLQCSVHKEGFNCDTDFRFGDKLTAQQVVERVLQADTSANGCGWVIATGGEPALQLDEELVRALGEAGYLIALETNGTMPIPPGVVWVSCSPKPMSPVVIKQANEVRVVVWPGKFPDDHGIEAPHYFVSPAFEAPSMEEQDTYRSEIGKAWNGDGNTIDRDAVAWAVKYCEQNPKWKLSLQIHKLIGVR